VGGTRCALGGKHGTLTHALDVLVDAGWIERHEDPLRDRRARFDITEPIVRFTQLIVEQFGNRLRRPGNATTVWEDARPVVRSQIYAPHLESIARTWFREFASAETAGGVVDEVDSSTIAGVGQLDLVAVERTPKGGRRVIAIGEVKSGADPGGLAELERLDMAATKLRATRSTRVREMMTGHTTRVVVSRAGFTTDLLRSVAPRSDVQLVDLLRLYHGD
jgi:hypothetical protein